MLELRGTMVQCYLEAGRKRTRGQDGTAATGHLGKKLPGSSPDSSWVVKIASLEVGGEECHQN